MKIQDLGFYVKFIFSSLNGEICLSTTDLEVLKQLKSDKTNESKRDYTIGDVIYFDSDEERDKKLEVTDIRIRRLTDKTESLSIGFDISDCKVQIGKQNEPIFIIHITIEKI